VSHDDFDFEPVPGLPRHLPPGERVLWRGRPDANAFAWRFLKFGHLTAYFLALLVWVVVSGMLDGAGLRELAASAATFSALALAALGLFRGYAALVERTTIYTLTDKRLVVRAGIALPITINLPFKQVAAAAMRECPDGTGEISLTLAKDQRVAYAVLWPHVKAWHFAEPELVLRCVPQVGKVANALAQALAASAHGGTTTIAPITPIASAEPAPSRDVIDVGLEGRVA
jgi:hypothetical protein